MKVLILALKPKLFFSQNIRGRIDRVLIRLPECQECRKSDPVRYEHVDFERKEMSVLVNRAYWETLSGPTDK